MSDKNLVLIDWLSITTKIHSPQDVISLLGMESVTWDTVKGAHGYKDRLYYNKISIHYNGGPDMGVWLEMSGQGCRCFETVGHGDFDFLLKLALDNPGEMKITRLDIAYDDHTGVLDIDQICNDTLNGSYVAKATSWECIRSSKGTSVVIGSMQSPVLIRIYDKARERGYSDGRHWIRVELQLRDDRATEFAKIQMPIGESFVGVLLNYLRYVVPDPSDTNKWRWPLTEYWSDLVLDACRIKIYTKPGMNYNVLNCEDFVYRQAGNAIEALLRIYDVDEFLDKLRKTQRRHNPKYDQMVNEFLEGASYEELTPRYAAAVSDACHQ